MRCLNLYFRRARILIYVFMEICNDLSSALYYAIRESKTPIKLQLSATSNAQSRMLWKKSGFCNESEQSAQRFPIAASPRLSLSAPARNFDLRNPKTLKCVQTRAAFIRYAFKMVAFPCLSLTRWACCHVSSRPPGQAPHCAEM